VVERHTIGNRENSKTRTMCEDVEVAPLSKVWRFFFLFSFVLETMFCFFSASFPPFLQRRKFRAMIPRIGPVYSSSQGIIVDKYNQILSLWPHKWSMILSPKNQESLEHSALSEWYDTQKLGLVKCMVQNPCGSEPL